MFADLGQRALPLASTQRADWPTGCSWGGGSEVANVIWTILVILFILWLIGLVGHIGGSLINILLVLVVIGIIYNLLAGRRAV